MKLFKLLVFVLLFSFGNYSGLEAKNYGFIIDSYKDIPQMDYQLELVIKYPKNANRLLLDCQSFINGIHYIKFNENQWKDLWFLMLSGNQCEDIAFFSKAVIEEQRAFCLFINLDAESVDLYEDLSECQ